MIEYTIFFEKSVDFSIFCRYYSVMDIISLASAMSQANVQQQASVMLLSKTLDSMQTAGAEMMQILPQPAPLAQGVGAHIDVWA